MSFLDDFFAAAQALEPSTNIIADVSIAISPASPFPTKVGYPNPVSLGWGQLTYTPARLVRLGQFGYHLFPAYFEGEITVSVSQFQGSSVNQTIALQVTAPPLTIGVARPYGVSVTFPPAQPASFAAEVDPTTNVVYGAEGSNFIAISLGIPFSDQIQ